MKDITRFINTQLKPRFYEHIPQIFPELHFERKGRQWQSPLHADGTEGTGKKADRCVVTEKRPYGVWDNTRQEGKEIIALFMELNNIREVWEAVNQLCDIVGIMRPEYTPEAKARYEKAEKRRTAFELSLQRQRKALFSPEGKAVLDYLLSRGWTEEEIKKAELGYISDSEAATIDAQKSVGNFYKLSIPLRSGSTLYGFKFRTIENLSKDDPRDKYTYLYGTEKKENLFNLTGVQQSEGSIVVVEGELDALHAEVRGVKGVVATGGGKLTEELLTAATERGIKKITLLFDKDEKDEEEKEEENKDENKDKKEKDKEPAGAKYVRESIEIAHKRGISVLVATWPDGDYLPNGKKVHDIDEYLQKHSPEELQTLIDNAILGSKYRLFTLVDNFKKKHPDLFNDGSEIDLRNEVIKLANKTPNEAEREIVLHWYAYETGLHGKQVFTPEAMRAVADRERAQENALKQVEGTKKALREATALAEKGDAQEALKVMEKAAQELRRIETRAKYGKLLALPTEAALKQRWRDRPDELPTLYELSNDTDKELFTLPPGAITFICAPTNHGKSTILQNLALQVAEAKGEGDVLYFTFEEEGDAVALQMENKYVDTELCRNYSSKTSNNLRALRHFYKTGEDRYISASKRQLFHEKEADFLRNFYTSGKIRIYYEDYDSEELIEAIRTISQQIKVKAVFVDYIQLLSSRACRRARMQRTEELKEICKSLKNLCVETRLPLVVAAQLNRETTSPLEMHSQRIAEAADLERIANKILCVWNTSFPAQKSKDSKQELEELESKHHLKWGTPGKMFFKLTKNRGGVAGLEGSFVFDGNEGIIRGNYTPSSTEEQEDLPFEEPEEEYIF